MFSSKICLILALLIIYIKKASGLNCYTCPLSNPFDCWDPVDVKRLQQLPCTNQTNNMLEYSSRFQPFNAGSRVTGFVYNTSTNVGNVCVKYIINGLDRNGAPLNQIVRNCAPNHINVCDEIKQNLLYNSGGHLDVPECYVCANDLCNSATLPKFTFKILLLLIFVQTYQLIF